MSTPWHWQSNWPAPAKLNLFLHVVGQRADGYHLLQTVFRFIDRGDNLRFEASADSGVRLAKAIPGVPEASDLTVRAARLLQAETGCTQGVTIHLEKRLPMGGGLGGGSSDAATVLLALNHLWQLGLPRERLQALGLQLGADVPVFIYGRNAFAEGVGEALEAIELPEAWYVVLEPPVQVPTPSIFKSPDLCRSTPLLARGTWQPGLGHNDLQTVAVKLFPVVGDYLNWLGQYGPAMMTGSGACVFAPFADLAAAQAVVDQLPASMKGWLARGLGGHPLAEI